MVRNSGHMLKTMDLFSYSSSRLISQLFFAVFFLSHFRTCKTPFLLDFTISISIFAVRFGHEAIDIFLGSSEFNAETS